jgi:WD40 repeat protein
MEISNNEEYLLIFLYKLSTIFVYSLETFELYSIIKEPLAGIIYVTFSPNSNHLIFCSEFSLRLTIFDLNDEQTYYIRLPKMNTNYHVYPNTITTTNTSTASISLTGSSANSNLTTQSNTFTFTSDGSVFAILERNEFKDKITLYETESWTSFLSFPIETEDCQIIKFSPNNELIACVDSYLDYAILIYTSDGRKVMRYSAYEYALGIRTIAWSPSSTFLAIGSYDEVLRVFNVRNWKLLAEFAHREKIKKKTTALYVETALLPSEEETEQEELLNSTLANNNRTSRFVNDDFEEDLENSKENRDKNSELLLIQIKNGDDKLKKNDRQNSTDLLNESIGSTISKMKQLSSVATPKNQPRSSLQSGLPTQQPAQRPKHKLSQSIAGLSLPISQQTTSSAKVSSNLSTSKQPRLSSAVATGKSNVTSLHTRTSTISSAPKHGSRPSMQLEVSRPMSASNRTLSAGMRSSYGARSSRSSLAFPLEGNRNALVQEEIKKSSKNILPIPTKFEIIATYPYMLKSAVTSTLKSAGKLSMPSMNYALASKPATNTKKVVDEQPKFGVHQCKFSHNDRYFCAQSENLPNSVFIYETATMKCVSILHQLDAVRDVVWAPKHTSQMDKMSYDDDLESSCNRLAICTGSNKLYIWQPLGCSLVELPHDCFAVRTIQWAHDGSSMLLADRNQFSYVYLINSE